MRSGRWVVVLAGGEGARLRPLTRALTGDDRPKQFCAVVGEETLLEQTYRRAEALVPPSRVLTVVTRAHAPYYRALVDDRPLLVQPIGRGTAPAILYGLLRVAAAAPTDVVAILPSDHAVGDEAALAGYLEQAYAVAEARRDVSVLLGVAPDAAETEYGWIEPGDAMPGAWAADVRAVRGFWEKPTPALASALRARGCLWNSFVMVGTVAALVGLVERAQPELLHAFDPVWSALGRPEEARAIAGVYSWILATDFSRQVLSGSGAALGVIPMHGVGWTDLGSPERVAAVRAAAR
jgi:mannose-1-phosphate guanylyltransferase